MKKIHFFILLFLSFLMLNTPLLYADSQSRVFMFLSPPFASFRMETWKSFEIVKAIENLGVTDIIIIDSQRGTFFWNSKIPTVFNEPSCEKKDCLKEIVEASHKFGLNIWLALHVTEGNHVIDEVLRAHWDLYARDYNGRIYKPPHLDVFNPKVKKYWYSIIDEIATMYNKYGNIKGFFWDEVWFNSSDLFGDDIEHFTLFCEKEFGEKPNEEVKRRFEAEYYAKFNFKDKWWRRYALFRQYANYQFIKELSEYVKSKGFAIIHRPKHSGIYKKGWLKVSIPHELISLADSDDYTWTTAKAESEIYYNGIICIYPRFSKTTWGEMCSKSLQGLPTCMFTYEWLPFQEGNIKEEHKKWAKGLVDDLRERLRKFFKISREWIGTERIAPFAILTYQRGLTVKYNNPQKIFKDNEAFIARHLRSYCNVPIIHVEDKGVFLRYKVLIAPFHSLQCLKKEYLSNLLEYVSRGNFLVSFSSHWSIAKNDFSNEEKVGKTILGIKKGMEVFSYHKVTFTANCSYLSGQAFYTKGKANKVILTNSNIKVLAKFENNAPAITFTPIGKGGVILFHFDPKSYLFNKGGEIFYKILSAYSQPQVESSGLKIMSVLKKNDKILISLFQNYKALPANSLIKVHVDRVEMNAKKFEILNAINDELIKPEDKDNGWTAEKLKKGIKVKINKKDQYVVLIIKPVS